QKALVIFQEVKDHDALALLYNNLGGLLKAQEKYKQAIDNYKQGLSYTGLSADVNTKANLYFNLSETYAAVGVADSAILYSTKYTLYNDTIADAYRDAMNARYNLAIAENEIQRLNLEQIEEKRKRMEFYGSVAFGVSWLLLGLAVMGYYLNRQRRRLVEQQSILSQQRVLELVREKELETNYALMQGVETTRKKIGRELHDSIGSMLSIAKVYFTSFNEKVSNIQEENRQQYQKANDLLDDACEKVRQISHEMTSAILVQFGLKTQLEALADTLRGTGFLQVELSTYGLTKRLDTQTEINIYRIIQELTSNVIKHAQAKKISIQVNRFDEMINVMVEDNGVGFDVEGAKTSGDGIGLKNVAARVHGLEGTIRYDSSPGKGTSVTVDIPISDDPPLSIDNS
ncbi:MAG: sensor histidine kinase, partial [Lewinella sp.]|nr:sensor histidine kinase [Lewinella sp.]